MSRKKKKNRYNEQYSTPLSSAPIPSASVVPAPAPTERFDAAEDRIRGEEMMMQGDLKKAKESRQVKKALDDQEVDRRLEELRRQLGLRKK